MSEQLSLGRKGKLGDIDFSKIKSGIKKEELLQDVDPKLKSVFEEILNEIDTNPEDNMISRNELQEFFRKIQELAKDDNFSKREGRKFELNGDTIGRKGRDALFALLNKMQDLSKDVETITQENIDGQNVEVIKYKNGTIEQVFADGKRVFIEENASKITEKDKNGIKTKQSVTDSKGKTVTTFFSEGTKKTKEVITNSNNNETTTITYDDQEEPLVKRIEYNGDSEEYKWVDVNGKKQWLIQKIIEKDSKNEDIVTEYEYQENGTIVETRTSNKSRYIHTKNKDGHETSVLEEEGKPVIHRTYNDNGYVDNYKENDCNITNTYDDNSNLVSQVVVSGTTRYNVTYDAEGNTLGVIVQNGETIKSIASKFGVDVHDLIRVNHDKVKGKYPNAYFPIGEEIKIPPRKDSNGNTTQIPANDKALQGRKSREVAIAEYQRDQAILAEKRRVREEQEEAARVEKYGATIVQDEKTGYFVTKDSSGKYHYFKNKKTEITENDFKTACPETYAEFNKTKEYKKTKNKYDVAKIRTNAKELATSIHGQISYASLNENTINLLRGLTNENIAFVIEQYKQMYKVSLVKDIDEEWGLNYKTIHEYICPKLKEQANSLGLKVTRDYKQITDIKDLENWVEGVAKAIREKMSSAKITYTTTQAKEQTAAKTQEKSKMAENSAAQIVNDLLKHISGRNDIDAIKRTINQIDTAEELKEVNRLLTIKGFPPTDKYSPIEHFIYEECNHDVLYHEYNSSDYMEEVVQKWIDIGVISGQDANEAQARMAARVLWDGGDGFGTDPDKIKKAVRMIKCPRPTGDKTKDNANAREVYRLVNNLINKHNTFYGLGSPCDNLRDYCEGELWGWECDYLDCILAETNAIQGQEKTDAIVKVAKRESGRTLKRLDSFDIDFLKQAIRAIDTPETREEVEKEIEKYCKERGIEPRIKGQSYLQALIHAESNMFIGIGTSYKEIRDYNEMLISQGAYNNEEAIQIRAEQAVVEMLDYKDFAHINAAVSAIKDPDVYKAMLKILSENYNGKSFYEFLKNNLSQVKADLVIATLASNSVLVKEDNSPDVDIIAQTAYNLIKNSDYDNQAKGFMAIRCQEVAEAVDTLLKKNGSSLQKELEKFNKDKAFNKGMADFLDSSLVKLLTGNVLAEIISDEYRENTDISDNMYIKAKEPLELTEDQINAYEMTVKAMEDKFNKMIEDYERVKDDQGVVSMSINQFCEMYNLGTTREEIEQRIEHDRETIRLLKLASTGELAKMVDGKPVAVSFESVFKERQIGHEFNVDSIQQVAIQAEKLVAMDYSKEIIKLCWNELYNANTQEKLAVAIIDTLEKLSVFSEVIEGKKLTLDNYGYSIKNGLIVDKSDNPVAISELQIIVEDLKKGLSDLSVKMFNKDIPGNSKPDEASERLEEGYNAKLASFKEEYRKAFGQDVPDELIDDYLSTINKGMIGVKIVGAIAAIVGAVFTGGGTFVAFCTAACTSAAINIAEHSTDANGLTTSELTSDLVQASWDGVLTAMGLKFSQFAEAFAQGGKLLPNVTKWISKLPKNQMGSLLRNAEALSIKIQNQVGRFGAQHLESKLASLAAKYPNANPLSLQKASVLIARAEAAGIEVTSDVLQSLVQTYCMEGEFDEQSFFLAFCISLVANSAGHAWGARGQIKELNSGAADAVDGAARSAERGYRDPVADREVAENIDTKHLNANQRKMVEDGIEDSGIPTKEELDAYHQDNGYREPTPEERADIDRNNAEAQAANRDAHRVEENLSDEGLDALRKMREKMNTSDVVHNNGIFKDNAGNEFKIENGKIVEIKTADGRIISDELKIAKFTNKYKIDIDNLQPVKSEAPSIEAPRPEEVKVDGDEMKADGGEVKANGDDEVKAGDDEVRSEDSSGTTHSDSNVSGTEKAYSEMDENELFTEYYRLKLEMEYSPLSNTEKAANIKKMKEINKLLEQKGFKIEGDKLVSIKRESTGAAASKPVDDVNPTKSKFSPEEFISKYGKALYKSYKKAEHYIKNIVTINDFNKAVNYIKAKFNKAEEVLAELMERAEAQAKKLGLKIKKTVYGETTSKYFNRTDVVNFVNETVPDPNTLYSRMLNLGYESTDATAFRGNQGILSMYDSRGKVLYTYVFDDAGKCVHKSKCFVTRHADGSFTRHSDLTVEYVDGKNAKVHIDEGGTNVYSTTMNVRSSSSGKSYSSAAERKRAETYSKFDKNAPSIDLPNNGATLNQYAQYALDMNNLPKLTLLDGTVVDFNNPTILAQIKRLREGDFFIIGRDADVNLPGAKNTVSGHHILVTCHNGQIVIKDVSRNGNTTCFTSSRYNNAAGASSGARSAHGTSNRAAGNSGTKRGLRNTTVYDAPDINSLRRNMADKLNNFSPNTQETILKRLQENGSVRLQKNGVEYNFTMRGGAVKVDEFDITVKYDIKTRKIDEYRTETTCQIENNNDIKWAICDEIDFFSDATRARILDSLQNGKMFSCEKGGIVFNFSIENGTIRIKKFEKARWQAENVGNRGSSTNGSQNSNRAGTSDNASSYRAANRNNTPPKMSPEERAARIDVLNKEIKLESFAKTWKEEFADILDRNYIIKNTEELDAFRKRIRPLSQKVHPDIIGEDVSGEITDRVNDIMDYLRKNRNNIDINEVNLKLKELQKTVDDYANASGRKAELAALQGETTSGGSSTGAGKNIKPTAFDENGNLNIFEPKYWERFDKASSSSNYSRLEDGDIEVTGQYTGNTRYSQGKRTMPTIDSRLYILYNSKMKAKLQRNGYWTGYNPQDNVTVIAIEICDAFSRPGSMSIQIKGQISADYIDAFVQKLRDDNIIPSKNYINASQWESIRTGYDIARKIEEAAKSFFNARL